jgi:cell division protein FtsI/penicillin-binding protein 2
MKSSFAPRSRLIIFCVIVFGGILLAKLFLVQVVRKENYQDRALHQYVTPASDIFERGTIYFSAKDGTLVSAATQSTGYKVAINASKISDPEDTYQKLNKIFDLDYEDFTTRAKKKNDPYEEIAHKLTKEEADKISALKLSGVSIFKEKWRFYPGLNMASQTIGLVGYEGDELGGRYGIERSHNAVLARGADNPYVNFFAEIFSNIETILDEEDVAEGDVITTIEPQVAAYLEKKLVEVKSKYNVDSIGGIVMNPNDGAIYALASKPDFDPNDFSDVKNPILFSNPLVENVLEFGSVVKPLVVAAALHEKVITPTTTYDDKGSIWVEKKEIFNFDKRGRGLVTIQEVLNQSLNTGMVFIEQKLGKEKLREYLLSYGLKEKTGIDLPNETAGLVSGILKSPREIEYANAAFGQGIAFTPVAITRALASLANGGMLVVPHVVKEIKYETGLSKKFTYPTTPTKISKETSEEITRMLVNVVDKALKQGTGKLEHFSVAAKTGTAQVADNVTGGYYEDRHTHSFFGYFPAYDPEFIVFLYAVNPKGVAYAADTWANPFFDLAKFLLNYYNVPPDR